MHNTKGPWRICEHINLFVSPSVSRKGQTQGPRVNVGLHLLVNVGSPSAPWKSDSSSSSSSLSQKKMHLYFANVDIIGLLKIPEDFNCRKSLKFKSLIVVFALEAEQWNEIKLEFNKNKFPLEIWIHLQITLNLFCEMVPRELQKVSSQFLIYTFYSPQEVEVKYPENNVCKVAPVPCNCQTLFDLLGRNKPQCERRGHKAPQGSRGGRSAAGSPPRDATEREPATTQSAVALWHTCALLSNTAQRGRATM